MAMARSNSPLRYPGGKTCLYDLAAQILRLNKLERGSYAEPYAGGAGLALTLLFGGHVGEIHLNDIDRSVWAFWDCVLNQTDALTEFIRTTPVNMDAWHRQRSVCLNPQDFDDLTLGCSTFFLNRTNRSGIVKGGGVIGGLNQDGNYKIDCRFNRDELIRRVRRIAKYKSRIHLYFNKGSSLYTSFYNPDDHAQVSQAVLCLERPWILTYDNTPEISHLYKARRQFGFDVNYSVQTKRVGTELLVASKGLKMPSEVRSRLVYRPQYRAA